MVILNVHISNFRLLSTSPFSATSPISLRLWSTTRRICGVESPPATPPSNSRNCMQLTFAAAWALSWTERLPDRLAQRAAALHVAAHASPKPKLLGACAPKRRVELGVVRVDFLDLATGTVCRAHSLRDGRGDTTGYTLSFDVVVEEVAKVTVAFRDLRLWIPALHGATAEGYTLSVEHIGGRSVAASGPVLQRNGDSSEEEGEESHDRDKLRLGTLPSLPLHASNLYQLAHGSLRIRVSDASSAVVAQASVPVHDMWSAIAHPAHATPLRVSLSDDVSFLATVSADRPPPTGQMSGGVTTDLGVTGARPVIFGALLPGVVAHVVQADGLPAGWVRLVDTFGYRYFHNCRNAVDAWTPPPGEAISEAIRHDELRALQHGFERGKYGVFRSQEDGSETWIHPAASRLSMPSYTVPDVAPTQHVPAEVDIFNSLSTFDMSELHPAAFTRVRRNGRMSDELKHGAAAETMEMPRGRVVEMMWEQLPKRYFAPGPETEGHTLTAVNDGETLLKFGGSRGSGRSRMNALHSYDVETSKWREVEVSGVLPAARTGHGAVALGTDQSQLLIFGGSSPQGRRNDLHMFHVANKTWSPVSCTGTPPEVRARMGMTVTSDGSTALVFGGRSLYRYLGGKYYDFLFVNAFHAERSQWVQMRPQGCGPRPAPRSGCVVEFLNGRHMLVHGGYDDGDRFFDDTFLFDMVSCSWQRVDNTPLELRPQPRESHMSAMVDGNVLIYGGDSKTGLLSDMHVFDAGLMRWTSPPSQVGLGPGKICGGAMAGIGQQEVLLVGGDTGFTMSRAAFKLGVSRRSTIDAHGMAELARERGPDAGTCVVCLDANVDTMFLWCGHSVCCRTCARMVKRVCPVCRQPFSKIVHSQFAETV